MNLIIDFGNTRVKVASFLKGRICRTFDPILSELQSQINNLANDHSSIIYSSVIDLPPKLKGRLQELGAIELDHSTPLPIINKYHEPKSLGKDRLANAVGAYSSFPDSSVLVLDFGTCVKYDLLVDGDYMGGAISPGLKMRYEALNTFTNRLPSLSPSEIPELTGNTTQSSMRSGVERGIINEVNGFIEEYKTKFVDLKVVLTGGDHSYFAPALKSTIFARPNLTLEGLNKILEFNL